MGQGLSLAVLGAAGPRGEDLVRLLAQRGFPFARLLPLDDDALLGRYVEAGDQRLPLVPYPQADFAAIDLALVCEPVPAAVLARIREQGCTLIAPAALLPDCGRDPVLAEVNLRQLALERGMLLPVPPASDGLLASLLSPLHDQFGLVAVHGVWIRAVGADGRQGIEALASETAQRLNGKQPKAGPYPQPIAFNLLLRDANAERVRFLSLWRALWGEALRLSLSTLVAPLFHGDLLSLSLEVEQACSLEAFRQVLSEIPESRLVAGRPGLLLSATDSASGDKIDLAEPEDAAGTGRHFTLHAAMDAERLGLVMNQLKIAEYLNKNLFISYS
jgi:aspartate-semialdehyde dehydrogenase